MAKHFQKRICPVRVQIILHIFEILLLCPFSNAKCESMFSRMGRVENGWRNRLTWDRLYILLWTGEEGFSLEDFILDPYIDTWYSEKICRLLSGPHKYLKKGKYGATSETVDLVILTFTLSDIEDGVSDLKEIFYNKHEHSFNIMHSVAMSLLPSPSC